MSVNGSAPTNQVNGEQLEAARTWVQQEREDLQRRLEALDEYSDWLDKGVELAEKLQPAGLPVLEAPVPSPKRRGPRKQQPRKAAPARRTGSRRVQRINGAAEDQREQVLEYIRKAPRCGRAAIVNATGLSEYLVGKAITKLAQQKKIETFGVTRNRCYSVKGAPLGNGNGSGPKTEAERRVFDLVKEKPLTSARISQKTNRSIGEVNSVCEGMARRGVLERLDADDPPVRYAPA